jgi:WD40 repeat protein
VTLSKDATARVWDAASGACLRVLTGHGDALAGGRLFADDALLVTWALDASVPLWDVASGTCLAALPMPAPVAAAAVAPRGGRLAASLADGSLALWDAAAPARCARIIAAHGGSDVAAVAFSADGALLASAAADGTARLSAPAAGGALVGLNAADAALAAVHLDGAAGTLVAADERGVVHFVDARPPPLNE